MKTARLIFTLLIYFQLIDAQETLTLDLIIEKFTLVSPPARQAALLYENAILSYKNYRKGFLPTLTFSFDPLNFNRSIKALQDPANGDYSYINDYINNSSSGLNIRQAIGKTGGAFNINSRLNMLSEYKNDRYSFNTTIFNVSYSQPLFGGYKNYRFQKTIQETQKEQSIKAYCKEIVDIQFQAVSLFMNLYLLKKNKMSRISIFS